MKVKWTYTTGRRKTSSARVYLSSAAGTEGTITVNGLAMNTYFRRPTTQMIIRQPLELTERLGTYDLKVTVQGGGMSGQAGAVLQGISRVLCKIEPELRPVLKKAGFLTRDARNVERKKPGRHKARKRPQYSKR